MTKRQRKGKTSGQQQEEEELHQFEWIPLWGWILIFLGPLALSEFMFYKAGRIFNMVVFPVAWIGFWFWMMHRSGWPILKKRNKEQEDKGK